ncbi:aminotransferase class V-fold PLP-dependent enzyme [Idiomarina piscisalsi]|uniref:aminotransferase class V-fold PLP-dependent enzyme n=1 Tax=Idiomarina piscisalsi TaxID=1096243 RepID=UPI00137E5415|nr:aminotransferase class V-fold PLP-dependent enzyme [Idiomarina piscisalsi]MTJ01110.1 aminotransferase class V-fold PLP-dependent enzyme [Idiomarina piscisalsi]
MKPIDIQTNGNELYLDCNATTPVLPQIAEAVSHTMETVFGNPSSSHITGLKARYILDTTRQMAREVVGLARGRLIFTSGATEGIQTAVVSAIAHAMKTRPSAKYLLYGATEHKAVPQALEHWNELLGLHAELKAIPVDRDGRFDLDFIARHVSDAAMICTMAVNNETGVIQDLNALERTIRTHNASIPWMVDCVQALGKLQFSLDDTSIDYAPFSGHKLYGPKGIGFMAVREKAPFTPLLIGGGQESGQRSGTENLPGIAALNALFELLITENEILHSDQRLKEYRRQLSESLKAAFPTLVFNHSFELSVPTTLNFSVRGVGSRDIMDVFDACGIRVSGGSACSSKVVGSFVLRAMGLDGWQSESAIRMSFGPATSQQDIDEACYRIRQAGDALKHSCLLIADTNNDNDAALDGVVQLKYDTHCCYLVIDKLAKELAVIDPHPALSARIENIVNCRGYTVKTVLSTDSGSEISEAAKLLRGILRLDTKTHDVFGWPGVNERNCDAVPVEAQADIDGCIKVGERRLFRLAGEQPVFVLSEPARLKSEVKTDFVFSGSAPLNSYQSLVSVNALVCPKEDPEHHLVYSLCETMGDCDPGADVNIPIGETDEFWCRDDLVVIDVRERQEHVVSDIPCSAEVVNVPVTEAIQFIHDHQELKDRDIICVCRSGNRSAVVANALQRHGFKQTRHLMGGLALLSSPAAKAV